MNLFKGLEGEFEPHLHRTHTSFALDNGFFVVFAIEFLHSAIQICLGFELHKTFAVSVTTNFRVNDIGLGLPREVFEVLISVSEAKNTVDEQLGYLTCQLVSGGSPEIVIR